MIISHNYGMRMHEPHTQTLEHEHILELHSMLTAQKFMKTVFYDGACRTPSEFVQFVRSPLNAFFAVYDGITPAAVWWLTSFTGQAAMINFCVFRDYFDRKFEIGNYVCDYCLKPDAEGNVYLRALYGLTPKVNRSAIRFVTELGFIKKAELPAACMFNGRLLPGVLTVKELCDGS